MAFINFPNPMKQRDAFENVFGGQVPTSADPYLNYLGGPHMGAPFGQRVVWNPTPDVFTTQALTKIGGTEFSSPYAVAAAQGRIPYLPAMFGSPSNVAPPNIPFYSSEGRIGYPLQYSPPP